MARCNSRRPSRCAESHVRATLGHSNAGDPLNMNTLTIAAAYRDLHEWVMSLPWVVERPARFASEVRTFAVECEPLERCRLWLITGMSSTNGLAVIVPAEAARDVEASGLGRAVAPMPPYNTLVALTDIAARDAHCVEKMVLVGYSHAMGSI